MTELDLYKFVTENKTEYHWHDKEVYLFVDFDDLKVFNTLIGNGLTDEGGLACTMKNGYVCFEMVHICEYHDILPERIFTNKDSE